MTGRVVLVLNFQYPSPWTLIIVLIQLIGEKAALPVNFYNFRIREPTQYTEGKSYGSQLGLLGVNSVSPGRLSAEVTEVFTEWSVVAYGGRFVHQTPW